MRWPRGRHNVQDGEFGDNQLNYEMFDSTALFINAGPGIMSDSTIDHMRLSYEEKPHELYQSLFAAMLKRCQCNAPGHGFRFNNEL